MFASVIEAFIDIDRDIIESAGLVALPNAPARKQAICQYLDSK